MGIGNINTEQLQNLILSQDGISFLLILVLVITIYNHISLRIKYRAPLLSRIYIKDVGIFKKKKYLIADGLIGLPDLVLLSPFKVTIIEIKGRHFVKSECYKTKQKQLKEEIQAKLYGGMAAQKWPLRRIDIRLQYANEQRIIDHNIDNYRDLLNQFEEKRGHRPK